MFAGDMPSALRKRLGDYGSAALIDVVDERIDEREPAMIAAAVERFERRLVEEGASLRVQLAQDLAQVEARIRQDIADGRAGVMKWSFLFWIGQALALAGFFGVMIRMVRP